MEFLGDVNNPSAVDVVAFVRQVAEKFPDLRASILNKLMETFADMKSSKVFRGALWIIGEYCQTELEINEAWDQIRQVLGEVPLLASEQRLLDEKEREDNDQGKESDDKVAVSSSRRILPDGTYATESAYTETPSSAARLDSVKSATKPPLRGKSWGGGGGGR
jgi:coatomer subunit beta